AKAQAEQLAEQAGIKLGRPTYLSESSYLPSPVYQPRSYAFAEAMPPAPIISSGISPGEMEVTLTVQLAYAIAE
ncbi:MAG: SIMPL domain-containing protein, partial [Dehalococcoidales bacterium]